MPKHVPTFKHLISTSFSQRTDKSQRQEQRSVTEILADLRANSTPPSHSDIADQERLWTGETGAGLLDVERGVVHPYVVGFPFCRRMMDGGFRLMLRITEQKC